MPPKRAATAGPSSTPPAKVLNLKALRSPKTKWEEKDPFFQVIGATYQDKARLGQETGAMLGTARVTMSKNATFYSKIDANRLDDDAFGKDSVRRTWGKFQFDNGEEGKHVTWRIRSPAQEDMDRLAYAETMEISIDDVPKHDWTSQQLAKCSLTVFPLPGDSSGALGVAGELAPIKMKLAAISRESNENFHGLIVAADDVAKFREITAEWGYILDEYTATSGVDI